MFATEEQSFETYWGAGFVWGTKGFGWGAGVGVGLKDGWGVVVGGGEVGTNDWGSCVWGWGWGWGWGTKDCCCSCGSCGGANDWSPKPKLKSFSIKSSFEAVLWQYPFFSSKPLRHEHPLF